MDLITVLGLGMWIGKSDILLGVLLRGFANLLFFFGDQLPPFSSSLRTRELTLLRDDGCLQAGDLAEIKKTFG